MIKFILDKIRTAPGPLREPRLLLADIAEEILDTAREYVEGPHRPGGDPPAAPDRGAPRAEEPSPVTGERLPEPERAGDVAPGPQAKATAPAARPRELEIDPRLERAVSLPANLHKQDFKVLAILWDAHQRGLVPLSAKAVSTHGERIGLAIRHENVRKVVRMRLEKYVDFHNEGAGTGTIYRYVLNAAGREHFAATYLRESGR